MVLMILIIIKITITIHTVCIKIMINDSKIVKMQMKIISTKYNYSSNKQSKIRNYEILK